MSVFTIVGLLLFVYAFSNYKKAFIYFLVFRLFLNQNINIISMPGVPLLTLEFSLCFSFWILFLVKRKSLNTDDSPFPLRMPFLLILLSYFLSSLFGLAGIGNSFTSFIKILFEGYVSIWMIWVVLKSPSDYKLFIKCLVLAFFVIGIYALYEGAFHSNPLMQYEISIAGSGDRVLDWGYGDDTGRGYRVQGMFIHAIGAGMNWGLLCLVFVYLYIYYKQRFVFSNKLYLCTFFVSIVCVFMTNSRGPILFVLIGLLPLVNVRKRANLYLVLSLVFGIALVCYYNSEVFSNALSMFDQDKQADVGGSNLSMRLLQFAAAFQVLRDYPVLGVGLKGLSHLNGMLVDEMLGLESIWLWVIVERGAFGVITVLYLIYTLIIRYGYSFRNAPVIFLSLAFFTVYSFTSVPGFCFFLLYAFIFMFIKIKFVWNQDLK